MQWSSRRWPDMYALVLRMVGAVALLAIPFKHLPRHLMGLEQASPVNLAATSHLVSFCLALALFYVAAQISLRKRNSWYLAVVLLVAMIIAELLHFRNVWQLALYSGVLVTLVISRHEFVVSSDPVSARRGLLISGGLLLVVLVFVAIVFEVIDQRAFGKQLTTGQTLRITYEQLTGSTPPGTIRLRRYDLTMLHLLRGALIAATVIVGVSLFRPLRLRWKASDSQIDHARRILRRYSTSVEDYFKLWPRDKHYYFYDDSFLAYAQVNGVALVLDGASGRPDVLQELRRHFLDYARLNGWQVAVVHADQTEADAWHELGLELLFIGSEAAVDVTQFVSTTHRSKHFRYVSNKAVKEGLQFEMWDTGISEDRLHELREVSDAWLRHGGRREYGFIMGYFDANYLRRCRIAVVRQQGTVVAYTNLLPSFVDTAISVDHIRSLPGTPGVTMHYLLMETIKQVTADGDGHITDFNLGLSPLSKLDERLDKSVAERLLSAIKQFGSRYYSFAGLEQFKGKFEPDWQPRYLVYPAGRVPTRLPQMALALNAATAYQPLQRQRRRGPGRWRLALTILAAVCYASFPLAVLFNRPLLFHGLVSDLGATGQPYAWLFNGLDIVSGIIAAGVLSWLIGRRYPSDRWLRLALWSALLAVVTGVMAAVLPLPDGPLALTNVLLHPTQNPQVIAHGLVSLLNSSGFVISVAVWGWYWYHHGHRKLQPQVVLALVALLLCSIGTVVGWWLPFTAGLLQRLFIVAYAVWLVLLVADIERQPAS